MPKTKTIVSKGSKFKVSKKIKSKLGNRKSIRGAHQLSTKELTEFVNAGSSRPRDRAKARDVLRSRPQLPAEIPVEAAA